MRSHNGLVLLAVLVLGCFLSSCGAGGEVAKSPPPIVPIANQGTADFFFLVIVPNQSVTTGAIEVQVIAESVSGAPVSAPKVVDHTGTQHSMTFKQLTWPRTSVASVVVFSATVPLSPDQINNLKALSGTREIPFSIRHRSALDIRVATNSTDLASLIKAAIVTPDIDVVEADYDEPDLGAVVNNLGNGVTNLRTTWLTVRPAVGRSMRWNRDSGTPMRRPMIDLINIHGVVFGGDASDGGGGDYYTELNHRVWVSESEFRAKYKASWPKESKLTAAYKTDVRSLATEGQKIYFTDCLWDGTASIAATSSVELARDLRFVSHRGDFNNFGRVFMNAIAIDVSPIRNNLDTDYLHNDGFQIWGNVGTTNLAFKGFRVESPTVPANLQPFLLDQTFAPNYKTILIDTMQVIDAQGDLKAHLAGLITDARISNISIQNQNLAIRQDFVGPNSSFAPNNVFVKDVRAKAVEYHKAGSSILFDYRNVPNVLDISPQLQSIQGLSGASFSNISVAPRP